MRHQDNGSALIQQVVQRGQGRINPDKIGNLAFVIHGNVVIHTDQYPFPRDFYIFQRFFIHEFVPPSYKPFFATNTASSTRRQE